VYNGNLMAQVNQHKSPKEEQDNKYPFDEPPKIQTEEDFWELLEYHSNPNIRAQKNPCDGLPSDDNPLKPSNSINLSSMALKNENLGGNTMISLSKAAFSPNTDGRFICGTEEQDLSKKTSK